MHSYQAVDLVAQRTRDYELVAILSPEATEEEVSATIERVGGLVSESGGNDAEHEVWGLRRLAYPIKKFDEGNYVLMRFTLNPDALLEFNRSLEASEDILRSLVTKVHRPKGPRAATVEAPVDGEAS